MHIDHHVSILFQNYWCVKWAFCYSSQINYFTRTSHNYIFLKEFYLVFPGLPFFVFQFSFCKWAQDVTTVLHTRAMSLRVLVQSSLYLPLTQMQEILRALMFEPFKIVLKLVNYG